MSVLTEVVAGRIWSSERSLWFSMVKLRSRTTVVRMGDGRLWVHSPGAPNDAFCAALDALGEVTWIVVPNRFHHLNAAPMKRRYPNAEVVGPVSVKERNPAVVIDRDVAKAALPEFKSLHLDGVPFLDETTFFHEPTQTLIAADLMMCGCAKDHFSWRWVSRVTGQYNKHKLPPDVRIKTKPSAELRRALGAMTALPLQRILVAHSDPVEDTPGERLAEAWHFALT